MRHHLTTVPLTRAGRRVVSGLAVSRSVSFLAGPLPELPRAAAAVYGITSLAYAPTPYLALALALRLSCTCAIIVLGLTAH